MTRLYLKGSWNNQYPPSVILPTREIVKKLIASLSTQGDLHHLAENHEQKREEVLAEVIETVLNCLTYKENAMLCLQYECLATAKEVLGASEEDKALLFTKQMEEFGRALFTELVELRAYERGCLSYVYQGQVNYDLVLLHRDYVPLGYTNDSIKLCPL